MIKVNELRLNNYVKFENGDESHQVQGVYQSSNCEDRTIQLYGNYISNRDDQLVGVPISDDWLLKFGFDCFPWGWVKKSSEDFGVRINMRSYNYDVSGNSSVRLDFVHQLQNLYFALTREELEVII